MTIANKQAAKTFGAIAFANGIKCAPALDSGIQGMIAGCQVGDIRTIPEIKAWIAGWTQANIAAN